MVNEILYAHPHQGAGLVVGFYFLFWDVQGKTKVIMGLCMAGSVGECESELRKILRVVLE